MIGNISPTDVNFDETMSTLRFANRARGVKNKPKINRDPRESMLRELQAETKKLKAQTLDGDVATAGVWSNCRRARKADATSAKI